MVTSMDSHWHTCILSSRKASPPPAATFAFPKTSLAQMAPPSGLHKHSVHISLETTHTVPWFLVSVLVSLTRLWHFQGKSVVHIPSTDVRVWHTISTQYIYGEWLPVYRGTQDICKQKLFYLKTNVISIVPIFSPIKGRIIILPHSLHRLVMRLAVCVSMRHTNEVIMEY